MASERESETGDLVHHDMGLGLPFRPATFDGVISVSALQWLCYSDSAEQDPKLRLNRFFSSLYSILKRNARAVLQFYPESPEQAVLIAQCASKVGFAGGNMNSEHYASYHSTRAHNFTLLCRVQA